MLEQNPASSLGVVLSPKMRFPTNDNTTQSRQGRPHQLVSASPAIWKRLALDRPELRAWALYDWANSAVVTTIIAAVFPIYFARVAAADVPEAEATRRFAVATLVAMAGMALIAPILGVIADERGIKKRMLATFLAIGAPAVAGLYFVHSGQWLLALALFVVIQLSLAASLVFYDALLPHVAAPHEVDRVSATGYALGYLGGGILLAANLAWIEYPQWLGLPHGPNSSERQATLPTRLAFLSVAVWWVAFSMPLFRRVPEPLGRLPSAALVEGNRFVRAWARLRETVAGLRSYKQAAKMLLAFLLYNEGIGTIIKLAAVYGAELGLPSSAMIGSILLVQFVGIPCTMAFGAAADRIGPRPAIFAGLLVYLAIAALASLMQSSLHFLLLALLVGAVQGGTQALSRSLFASLIPTSRSAQFFSLFALSEKLAGVLGPGLVVLVITLTGSSRYAIGSVVVFFLVGGILLSRVDIDAGRSQARDG
jgi:MFS transporter, UMF1 family